MTADLADSPRVARARAWFDTLRDSLVAAFEALEDEAPPDLYPGAPGRFTLEPWVREAGGGGVMGFLHGRFFEKCGLHVSEVHGTFTPEMAATMPGAQDDPRFVATGVSLIAHLVNPRVPAVHMNTRFITTTHGWFGGGADLTPLLGGQRHQDAPDAITFPRRPAPRPAIGHDPAWYAKLQGGESATSYFFLPHGETSPEGSAASSTIPTIPATGSATSPSPRTSAEPSWRSIPASPALGWARRGRRRSARSS